MKNVGPRNAFGGTIGLDSDFDMLGDVLFSFGPRYRYWLSQHASLDGMVDFSVGIENRAANVNIQAIWMYRDWVGVDAGLIFKIVSGGYERDAVRPFVGARLGSYPALVVCMSSIALSAILIASGGLGT